MTEQIDAKLFIVELYEEPIHHFGHHPIQSYFVEAPYNLIIICDQNKTLVESSDHPDNIYKLGYYSQQSYRLHDVKLSKSWVEACYKLSMMEANVRKARDIIQSSRPENNSK